MQMIRPEKGEGEGSKMWFVHSMTGQKFIHPHMAAVLMNVLLKLYTSTVQLLWQDGYMFDPTTFQRCAQKCSLYQKSPRHMTMSSTRGDIIQHIISHHHSPPISLKHTLYLQPHLTISFHQPSSLSLSPFFSLKLQNPPLSHRPLADPPNPLRSPIHAPMTLRLHHRTILEIRTALPLQPRVQRGPQDRRAALLQSLRGWEREIWIRLRRQAHCLRDQRWCEVLLESGADGAGVRGEDGDAVVVWVGAAVPQALGQVARGQERGGFGDAVRGPGVVGGAAGVGEVGCWVEQGREQG